MESTNFQHSDKPGKKRMLIKWGLIALAVLSLELLRTSATEKATTAKAKEAMQRVIYPEMRETDLSIYPTLEVIWKLRQIQASAGALAPHEFEVERKKSKSLVSSLSSFYGKQIQLYIGFYRNSFAFDGERYCAPPSFQILRSKKYEMSPELDLPLFDSVMNLDTFDRDVQDILVWGGTISENCVLDNASQLVNACEIQFDRSQNEKIGKIVNQFNTGKTVGVILPVHATLIRPVMDDFGLAMGGAVLFEEPVMIYRSGEEIGKEGGQ